VTRGLLVIREILVIVEILEQLVKRALREILVNVERLEP
jgi:hypothetical protein